MIFRRLERRCGRSSLKIVLGNGQKWWKIAPDEIKKKVAKKFLRKEKKKFATEIRKMITMILITNNNFVSIMIKWIIIIVIPMKWLIFSVFSKLRIFFISILKRKKLKIANLGVPKKIEKIRN